MNNTRLDMSDAFDNALLDILRGGREVVTRDGERVTIPATAADLNVIRQRLKDCGITAEAMDDNPVGNIVDEMRRRGLKLPELDTTEDDVATA